MALIFFILAVIAGISFGWAGAETVRQVQAGDRTLAFISALFSTLAFVIMILLNLALWRML